MPDYNEFCEKMAKLDKISDIKERIKLVKKYLADIDEENRQKCMKKIKDKCKTPVFDENE